MSKPIDMNMQLGTKWFTFYTKVRPILACLVTFSVVVDFISYTDVYLNNLWLFINFVAAIAQGVLCIAVAIKSNGYYDEFVRLVKGVLVFETINMAYGQGVQQYVQNNADVDLALVTFTLALVISYFVWYRLNAKYFEKRMLVVEYGTTDSPSLSSPEKHLDTQTNIALPAPPVKAQEVPTVSFPSAPTQISFCRKCGEKLFEGSQFCHKCGTQIKIADD